MAVQTITYEDKQYLNQNADIPATNKVQDVDMNEIKAVVNNNALEVTNIQNSKNYLVQTFSNVSCTQNSTTNLTQITLTTGTWVLVGQFSYEGSNLRYFLNVGSFSTSVYDNSGIVAGNVCGIYNVTGTTAVITMSLWPTDKNVTVSGSLRAVKYQ